MKSALQEQVESRHGHFDKIDWKWKCAAQIYIVFVHVPWLEMGLLDSQGHS